MTPTREDEFAHEEAQLDDLYREVILDHYRNPRHRGSLPAPTVSREGYNPLCGDEITLELAVDGGLIHNVAVRGGGCSISQSSASMMAEAIVGKRLQEVAKSTVVKEMIYPGAAIEIGGVRKEIVEPLRGPIQVKFDLAKKQILLLNKESQ